MAALGAAPLPAAPPAPLALAAPLVPHNFRRVTVAGADDTLDYVSTPANAAIVKAFPQLGWIDSSASIPNSRAAPALLLQGILTPAVSAADWDLGWVQAMLDTSELLAVFEPATLGRLADAFESMGLLSRIYLEYNSLFDFLEPLLAGLPSPSPLDLIAGDIVEHSPYLTGGSPAVIAVAGRPAVADVAAVPAVRAVPARRAVGRPGRAGYIPAQRAIASVRAVPARAAVPAIAAVAARPAVPPSGPPELEWWSHVKLTHVVDRNSSFPFMAVARRGMAALDRGSAAARADPTSHVHAASEILVRQIRAALSDPAAGPVACARWFRRFSPRLLTLPTPLRSQSFEPELVEVEMSDDAAYAASSVMQRDVVTAARLDGVGIRKHFPDLHSYLSRLSDTASKISTMDVLLPVLTDKEIVKMGLYARLGPLDTFFKRHSPFITQCFNKGVPVDGADGVTDLLLREHEEWKATGETPSARGDGPDVDDMGSGRAGLTVAALRRALVEDKDFVEAAEEILRADVDTEEGQLEALESALLAGCTIFQRFFARPISLLNRHAVFPVLYKCINKIPLYMGRAQAADEMTGEVPKLKENWLFAKESAHLLFLGKLASLPLLNGKSGALELFNLTASEPFLEVPTDQMYIVESVLELLIPFAKTTFVAAGWQAASATGYTYETLLRRQLQHVKWIRGQGDLEKSMLLSHAQQCFINALADAEEHTMNLLMDPEPASITLGCILPSGGRYDKALAEKTAGAEPILLIRKAFPGMLPASAPRSLEGVVLPSTSSGGKGGPSASPGGGGDGGGGGGGKKDDGDKKQPPKPGSLKKLPTWKDDTHMQLGALVYDVAAICKHYSIDVADFCAPFHLSNKTGGARLALCANWGEEGHTSLTSKCHCVPKSFNIKHIEKNFTTRGEGAGKRKRK